MVSQLSALLAGYLGYSCAETSIIGQAALYHDIGKNDLPKEILNKPGALTAQEFELVKTHTLLGSTRILELMRVLEAAYVIAGCHHEKVDGSGYKGLPAKEIPPYAKLVSVVDVLDALASKRAYKNAWNMDDVFSYLKEQAGIQFDPAIVSILLSHRDEVNALYR
jgi:putative two-component system response regulator